MSRLLIAALSFAVPLLASAAGRSDKQAELVELAGLIEQVDDEGYIEVFRANPRGSRGCPRCRYIASRPAALGSLYRSLAAFEYKDSLEISRAADGAETAASRGAQVSRDEIAASLKRVTADSDAVAIDPDSLTESGWFSDWINQPDYRPRFRGTAVAAVRGGRKLTTASDKELLKLADELKGVKGQLASAETGDGSILTVGRKAALHVEAGRLYEKMAATIAAEEAAAPKVDFDALASAPAAPAPAPAPAAPAAVADFSPKKIYAHAAPSVVLILCAGEDGNGELGTGSVIDESGRVLTNAHVVIRASTGKPFETIRVYYKPERLTGDSKIDLSAPRNARVKSYDRDLDLAVLELEEPGAKSAIALGDSERIEAGEQVVAIGHPEQGGLWTLTTGVVSTVIANLGGVKGKNVFQTDASINRGNSGGPLIDREGALIGVNTSMARKASDGLTITSVNFSVKSTVVKDFLTRSGVAFAVVAPAAAVAMVAPSAPKAAPVAPAPAPQAAPAAPPPAETPKLAEAPKAAPPAAKPAPAPAPKPAILTPVKPFKIEDVIAQEIREMEELESDMAAEVEKRRAMLNAPR